MQWWRGWMGLETSHSSMSWSKFDPSQNMPDMVRTLDVSQLLITPLNSQSLNLSGFAGAAAQLGGRQRVRRAAHILDMSTTRDTSHESRVWLKPDM